MRTFLLRHFLGCLGIMVVLPLGDWQSAGAIGVEFVHPCGADPILRVNADFEVGTSVGQASVQTLQVHGIKFVGAESGINSVEDSPTGDAALEIISDREMRAYGWCFEYNGVEPGLYPHEIFIQNDDDSIKWFFGYAWYKDGNWVAMCVPTHREKPSFICGS